jgi:transglutaminase-like putative cysteine protease
VTGDRRSTTPLAPLERDLAATAALGLYSLAVGVGFARVFGGWAFLPHFMLLVLIGHGSSFAMRRARVSGWISVPAMTLLMLWTVSVYQYHSTLSWIVPGRATWDQLQLDIGVVRDQFQTAVAPVIYEVGWATLAGLAMVIVIVMADAFAFKAEARGEALVPGGVLFIFIAALSRDRMRLGSAMLLVATGILAVIALRSLHDRNRQVELTAGRGRRSLTWPAAVGAAVAIALLAGVVGPQIPGAEADPLYQTRGRGGGITSVGNPLVSIRSRLVNHGDFELFRMNSDTERYWRLTTLPEFDGSAFRLPSRSLERVEDTDGDDVEGRTIKQVIQILALEDKMVPAAADVAQVRPNAEMRVNHDTGTLLKLTDVVSGEQFTIVSMEPDLTPAELSAATTDNPPDEIFLGVPDNVPDDVHDIAAEVTAGATTDYDRLIALQNWFRNTFEYTTEVQAGHGNNAIDNFLQIRKGYCEQFAATFAVMARTLGIPSRVAVGYTPGRLRSDGWYSVLGRNSHAWPEIWFDGIGWVDFEPTPQRGIPGAEDYTGVAPAQDESVPDARTPEAGAVTLPPTPTTVFSPPTTIRERTPGPGDPDARTPALPSGNATPTTPEDEGSSLPWVLLVAPVIVLLAAAFPAAARRWNRRAARQQGTPQRVNLAWQHACRAASRAGVDGTAAMTSREWATATAHKLPVAARPMASLAAVVDRVGYSRPESIEPRANTFGRDCELWSDQVTRIATDTLTTSERMRQYFRDLN